MPESSEVHVAPSWWPYVGDFIIPAAPHLCLSQSQVVLISSARVAECHRVAQTVMDIPIRVYAFWQPCSELFGRQTLQIVLIMGAYWVVNVLINVSVHLPLI